MEAQAEASTYNRLEVVDGKGIGVIASGIAYNYVKECNPTGVSAI